jgi:hypothetical protein
MTEGQRRTQFHNNEKHRPDKRRAQVEKRCLRNCYTRGFLSSSFISNQQALIQLIADLFSSTHLYPSGYRCFSSRSTSS